MQFGNPILIGHPVRNSFSNWLEVDQKWRGLAGWRYCETGKLVSVEEFDLRTCHCCGGKIL